MVKLIQNIALVWLLLLSFAAKGQYTSENGYFTVNEIRGCEGLTVNITFDPAETPCVCFTATCPCNIDYDGDGNYDADANLLTYTFNEAGQYRMEVLFPNPNVDYITIDIEENIAPDFDIYSCSGQTVIIDIADNNFDNYVIDFDDGTIITIPRGASDPQHTYTNNTTRTIEVRGLNNNASDNCAVTSKSVTPIVTIPQPSITELVMLDDNSLKLEYDLDPNIFYELQIAPANTGNYSLLKRLSIDEALDTIRNLNLSNNYFCFRIASRNPCTNTIAGYSNIICSINLRLAVGDGVNQLTWNTSTPDVNFTLERSDLLSRPMPASARSYNDTDLLCNEEYCYTLVANYTNGHASRSLSECGIAFSTSPPEGIMNISTIVNGNDIELEWESPANTSEYQISRSNSGRSFIQIANSASPTHLDINLPTSESSFCYQIGSTNECGNSTSESITACSILLTGIINSDNTIELAWNEYNGWENGVSQYVIEKSYPAGGTTQAASVANSYTETDNNNTEQIVLYKVIAQSNEAGITVSESNTIALHKPVNIFYPTAFTPDGNGLNEEFTIGGRFIVSYELRIYNRWGELIFTSDNMDKGWDGKLNGTPLPQGTYAFIADMTDMAGREITKTGTITLLRR